MSKLYEFSFECSGTTYVKASTKEEATEAIESDLPDGIQIRTAECVGEVDPEE